MTGNRSPRRLKVRSVSHGGYPVFSRFPGMAVGAAGACTGGVNLFPPVGLMLFSVGDTEGGVVELEVELVDGLSEPPPPHAASATAITPNVAAVATVRATRAVSRSSGITSPIAGGREM